MTSLRRPVNPNRSQRPVELLITVAVFGGALLAWWLFGLIFDPPTASLASPLEVWDAMTRLAASGELWEHLVASLKRLAIGIPVGLLSGYLVGLMVGRSQLMADLIQPVVALMTGISGLAWIPLAILWFGIGDGMVTFIIWNATFFVVLFNTVVGIQSISKDQEDAVRTLGGSGFDVLRSVVIPGAMAQVIIGLRSGVGFAWRALVAAELIGASFGLGHMIYRSMAFFRSDVIIGGCILLGVAALITDRLVFAPIERRTVSRWGMVSPAGR